MTRRVEIDWFHTETFTATVEVPDDFDPGADDADEVLEEIVCDMGQDELSLAFTGCTERTITSKKEVEGVGVPTPSGRVDMEALYPMREGESAEAWTGRVLTHSADHGVNRQCSIGWHGECSDRSGETCMCLCHDDATRWYTVEGDAEDGTIVTRRVKQGKQHWPPTPGEPATIWAVWIMGLSADDASARAIRKMEARRG